MEMIGRMWFHGVITYVIILNNINYYHQSKSSRPKFNRIMNITIHNYS